MLGSVLVSYVSYSFTNCNLTEHSYVHVQYHSIYVHVPVLHGSLKFCVLHMKMFGDAAPPIDWDTAGHYTRKAISVLYLSHAGTVLQEEQIVDVLRGEYPAGFVETGCQVQNFLLISKLVEYFMTAARFFSHLYASIDPQG